MALKTRWRNRITNLNTCSNKPTMQKTSSSTPLYLLDASIVFFKYYFSMPDHWQSDNGVGTGATYGYSHWLKRFLLHVKPQCVAACFDESFGTGFRHQLDPNYKISRPPPDDAVIYQMAMCKAITEAMGVTTYGSALFEADDLVGTLAARHRRSGGCNVVISRDKDLIQVIRPGDQFWHYPDDEPMDYNDCTHKMGVRPEQVADYLALVGDSVDDIAGIPGVGPKTAIALLAHFESLKHLYNHLDEVALLPIRGAKTLVSKLERYHQQVILARRLTGLDTKAALNKRYAVKKRKVDAALLSEFGRQLGFGRSNINPDA